MRALVISGGGSKGAFAGGVAQYLIEEKNHEYDLFIGTSTGSLLIPHFSVGTYQENSFCLYQCYNGKYF
jgi:NTE family protein